MKTLIIAAGPLTVSESLLKEIAQAQLVIAVDGGISNAFKLDLLPHCLLGDLDSISRSDLRRAKALKIPIYPFAKEKDFSDTELAFRKAEELGASSIVLLGALGGKRIDHTLANVFLMLQFQSIPWHIVDGKVRIHLLTSKKELILHGKKGELLSLLPMESTAKGLRGSGLYYALDSITLKLGEARGISNVFIQEKVSLSLEAGRVLVIHSSF